MVSVRTSKEKFATQADPAVLSAIRKIAADEGRQLQAVLDDAMRDYIEKKRTAKPRAHVLSALQESISEFDTLYHKLSQ
jgi:hypothetical protein